MFPAVQRFLVFANSLSQGAQIIIAKPNASKGVNAGATDMAGRDAGGRCDSHALDSVFILRPKRYMRWVTQQNRYHREKREKSGPSPLASLSAEL